MQKGSALIFVILIVLFAGGLVGAFYLGVNKSKVIIPPMQTSTIQPTPKLLAQSDYTSGWNVYTDQVYNFTFKYPKDWKLEKPLLAGLHLNNKTLLQINLTNPSYDKNTLLDLTKPSEHPSDPDKDPYAITIRVWDNKERKSLREKLIEVDKFFQNSQVGYGLLPSSDDINEHFRNIQNGSGQQTFEETIAVGDYVYLISGGPQNSSAEYKFRQIIPTFKFTNQNQAINTTNWTVYNSKDLYFKYPSDWTFANGLITSNSPKIKMVPVAKDSTLMNECMKQVSIETKSGFSIKRFEAVTTGKVCGGRDSNSREIWVITSQDAYAPGLSYQYLAAESKQAEEVFDQILASIKFTP